MMYMGEFFPRVFVPRAFHSERLRECDNCADCCKGQASTNSMTVNNYITIFIIEYEYETRHWDHITRGFYILMDENSCCPPGTSPPRWKSVVQLISKKCTAKNTEFFLKTINNMMTPHSCLKRALGEI